MTAASDALGSLRGCRIWMVGIGGTGMSGLARLMRSSGAHVRGEDDTRSAATDRLSAEGIDVTRGGGRLPADVDAVVATAAIPAGHPTLVAARARGLAVVLYAEALGRVMDDRSGVAVAGTHGKSTTTCLLTWCLVRAGLDPSFLAGATCGGLGGNARAGAGITPRGPWSGQPGLMVAESCEFDRSFLKMRPRAAIIGNVEADHLDCYGTLDAIVEAFHTFARSLPAAEEGGYLLIGHEGAHRERVAAGVRATVETFGMHPKSTHRLELASDGRLRVLNGGRETLRWRPSLLGEHNARNAAAAGTMALHLGADREAVEVALSDFAGLDRRQTFMGLLPGVEPAVRVYDDYGHHPTEVQVTLAAIRQATGARRLLCVFEPHQHSRTRMLLEEFGRAFADADMVILPPIHFVRDDEKERHRVSSATLAERIRHHGSAAHAVADLEAAARMVRHEARGGDVIVTMGAGNVWKVARSLVSSETAERAG
jgi:UDP-N-acetylmuramate--alanine ligase